MNTRVTVSATQGGQQEEVWTGDCTADALAFTRTLPTESFRHIYTLIPTAESDYQDSEWWCVYMFWPGQHANHPGYTADGRLGPAISEEEG